MSQETIVPADADTAALAAAYGVATEYWDQSGSHKVVSAATVRRALAALDVDVDTAEGRAAAWDRVHNGPWRRLVPPFVVMQSGEDREVLVHVVDGDPVVVWLELEDGSRRDLEQLQHWAEPRDIDGRRIGEAAFRLPGDLPLGYHRLAAETRTAAGVVSGTGVLAVTPAYLGVPARLGERSWGVMAQLYAARSVHSWGIGDLNDLGALAAWGGSKGGDFVLVNPMHAAEPMPHLSPSPYLPTTRRFFNPIYIRVEDIPEFAALTELQHSAIAAAALANSVLNRDPAFIERDPIWEAKVAALDTVFAVAMTPQRAADYAHYTQREGAGLERFARWSAFAEVHGTASQLWPEGLRHPDGPLVEAEAARLHHRVEFHKKCQWILDEQFAAAQARARAAGMRAGIVHDLAVGVHPDGADSWGLQDVMAPTMSVGAPPDMYNQMGQDWSQPPWRPDALEEVAYEPYRAMLRTILRHAGGIRVDHALGLFRLWWIPRMAKPYEGTFVKYNHEAFVGILALEAQRADAFVVGEDLGTVEPWIQEYLAKRGIMGTSILWFEHDHQGDLLAPERFRELCFTCVTVHDLPPTAGMWDGEHIRIRDDLHLLARPVEDEWRDWERERAVIVRALRSRGLLAGADDVEPAAQEIVEGLHAYIARTPSRMLAVALTDLVGDVRAQNQPGTDQEYPNWRVPTCDAQGVPVLIEDLAARADIAERADRLIAALTQR